MLNIEKILCDIKHIEDQAALLRVLLKRHVRENKSEQQAFLTNLTDSQALIQPIRNSAQLIRIHTLAIEGETI